MLYCEGEPLWIPGTTCVSVTSQLCIVAVVVVVSCCSGSMVGQSCCCAVVGYRQRMLYSEGGRLRIPGKTCGACCGCHQPVMCFCRILLLRIYGWAVTVLVRLGC